MGRGLRNWSRSEKSLLVLELLCRPEDSETVWEVSYI